MYSVPRKNFAAFPTDSVLRKPKSVSDFRYPAVLSAIRPLYPQIFRLFVLRTKVPHTLRIKIVFPQLGFNTEYTISFGENVKTIADCGITGSVAFKTMSDRPSFEVVETTPASGTTGIADEGASVKASYSLPIDFDTVDGSITVTPNASFDVKKVQTILK